MAYDSGIITFTVKTDKVDLVAAAHINAVQTELITIETILGVGVKGNRSDLKTRLANMMDPDGTILSGTSYPSPSLPSQGFYRTDLDVFYIMNAANSLWIAQGGSVSNVLFQYAGQVDAQGIDFGEVTNSSLVPNGATGTYRYLQAKGQNGGGYYTIWTAKFIKISGISTVTVWVRMWVRTTGGKQAVFKLDIGGANSNVSGTSNQITPEWKSFTIDVSGLLNGTTYDVTAGLQENSNTVDVYCSNIMGFGS